MSSKEDGPQVAGDIIPDEWNPLVQAGEGNLAQIRAMVKIGLPINTYKGKVLFTTPLHYAASGGHMDLVKYLVEELNCSVTAKTRSGKTPRTYALLDNQSKVAEYLRLKEE